jgi:hypothetical protein
MEDFGVVNPSLLAYCRFCVIFGAIFGWFVFVILGAIFSKFLWGDYGWVPCASLWMVLTPQTPGITFDLWFFKGARGGCLWVRDVRFRMIGVVWGPKILGIDSPKEASHLPKIWAHSVQWFGRSSEGKFVLTLWVCFVCITASLTDSPSR